MLLAIIGVVAVVLLTLGTAIFVAAEFSLVAADRAELDAAAEAGDRAARRVLAARRHLSFQLSGAQLGITITTLAVGFLAEPSLSRLLHPVLSGIGLTAGVQESLAVIVAILLATVLQMVLGELIPKNWAIARPMPVARLVAGWMRVFTTALRPVIAACNGLANLIVRGLGIEPQEELRSARSSAELDSLVRSSAEGGTLPDSTATIMTRSLRFSTKTAAEVMSPRTRITAMPETASAAALLGQAAATGHSRFPVSTGQDGRVDLDALDGVVHVKQAFTIEPDQRTTRSVGEFAGPLARVPLTLRLEPLLALLRRPGLQMVVVIDEYGGTAGIVTLEDVVEELVGTVEDEHDRSEELVRDEGGSTVLSAGLRLDEAADLAPGFSAPSGPYETIGGLILSRLGRVAQAGDEVIVNGWTLTVMTVDQRRIDTVRLRAPGRDEPR